MSVLAEVATELWSMFAADWRLTVLVLSMVGWTALLTQWLGAPGLASGAMLLVGSVAILAYAVLRAARSTG
jgi:hypothetical protein